MYKSFHTSIKVWHLLAERDINGFYQALMSRPFTVRSCDIILKNAAVTCFNVSVGSRPGFNLSPKLTEDFRIDLVTTESTIELLEKVKSDGFLIMNFPQERNAMFRLKNLNVKITQNRYGLTEWDQAVYSEQVDVIADFGYILYDCPKTPSPELDGTEGYNGA